jgi:SMODS and SLOG-associating 2TM effector domain 1
MAGTAGRVPLRLRVGVTGHRALSDERAIGDRVDEALARLRAIVPSTSTTPVLFEVVSPLGEGADRIVAARVLADPTAILEVPLPLPSENYEEDFTSDDSRRLFHDLVARAERVWVVGGSDRIDAYRRVGEYVVDSCDVLIAVWDGRPSRGTGGTADILRLAREQEMPVFVISAEPPFVVREERMPPSFDLFDDVDRYNRMALPTRPGRATPLIPSSVEPSGEEGGALQRLLSWAEPFYGRADAVARRCRTRFVWASRLLFLLSAFAILAVAISAESHDHRLSQGFATVEVALMVAALALWLAVRRRLHARWITARFLAERLRSAVFLAFAGQEELVQATPDGAYRATTQEWLTRILREIWRSRPREEPPERKVEEVKDLSCVAWVDPQIAYYRRRGESHATAFTTLTIMSAALFVGAIAAAIMDAKEVLPGNGHQIIVVLSIALPAFAGALTGVAALEQHARHAERFRLIAHRLAELRERLVRAPDLGSFGDVAHRVDAELRTEGDAWIDVMRFHDVEFPV